MAYCWSAAAFSRQRPGTGLHTAESKPVNNRGREEITALLSSLSPGEAMQAQDLLPEVYDELHRLAGAYMRRERDHHTLQPTALVHEAFLKLVDANSVSWAGRTQFFAVAARTMRRVLVNHAVHNNRQKRGGDWNRVSLDGLAPAKDRALTLGDVPLLEDALARLATLHERQARVVELRYFAGMTAADAARLLEVSDRTVERDWDFARAWLRRELARQRDA